MKTVLMLVLLVGTSTFAGASMNEPAPLMIRMQITQAGAGPLYEESYYWIPDRTFLLVRRITRIVVDLGSDAMTTIDTAQGIYVVDGLQDLTDQVATARRAIRTQFGASGPRRAFVERAGLDPWFRFTLTPTGRHDTIAGFAAEEFVIDAPMVTGSMWIAPAFRRPFDTRAWEPYLLNLGGMLTTGTKLAFAVARFPGFPVRSSITPRGGRTQQSEIVEVAERLPPADLRTIPPDYLPARRGPRPLGS